MCTGTYCELEKLCYNDLLDLSRLYFSRGDPCSKLDRIAVRLDKDEALRLAFGQALRRLREWRGYSQENLGGEADISRAHMSAMERGLHMPTLLTMLRLCDVLQIRFSRMAREIERDYRDLIEKG